MKNQYIGGQEEGGVFEGGIDTPRHTMYSLPCFETRWNCHFKKHEDKFRTQENVG